MAHIHPIEDAEGDIVSILWFCSDYCYRTHNGCTYGGWNGCHDNESNEICEECLDVIPGIEEAADY
tara:strand:- start:573 stop:770 length:198 start_codon:yes stop_codon:yes gene_type:complete